jgi:cobalt/nickel transport system ATP-binding protein
VVFELEKVSVELGGRPVLRDLSFAITEGERVVLLGTNGCGKSTLLKLLDGLIFPSAGMVRFGGRPLDRKSLEEAAFRRRFRSEVGLLFQNVDAMLFNSTVADEIAFGPRQLGLPEIEARVARWAEALGATAFLARPPFELSGGEKKRVAAAALLCLEPKVLLLDEVTASLDPASTAQLVELLAKLEQTTVLTATHNLSLAEELGTRALLLAPGRPGLLFDGPVAKLLSDERLLVESGLAHRHLHWHQGETHAHFHLHDLE